MRLIQRLLKAIIASNKNMFQEHFAKVYTKL